MPLHDAVGINFKQLLKIKAQVSYGLSGVCWMIERVLSDLTRLPLLGGGRKSWYIIKNTINLNNKKSNSKLLVIESSKLD